MKATKLYNVSDLPSIADELGALRADIAKLQADAKALETIIKDSGEDEVEGSLFRVKIVTSVTKTVAWKKIAEKLGATKQMIVGNTTVGSRTQVRVTALKKEA